MNNLEVERWDIKPEILLDTETSSAHGAGLACLPTRQVQLTILNS